MVAVFREVWRVLRDDGTLWLNLGSSYCGGGNGGGGSFAKERPGWSVFGGNDPIPSRPLSRVPSCGTDGTEPQGSWDLDSAYRGLCDECLSDFLSHRGRIADTLQQRGQDEPRPSQTDRDSEHSGSASASPGASPLDAQGSTTLESWLQRRGACSRCDSRASALLGLCSSLPDEPSSSCTEACRSDSERLESERHSRGRDASGTAWVNYPKFKAKDLVPIPWMVAMALQSDGWYLRSDIIWAKPNCMPSSVRDRPTSAHEYLFLLTKSARYYFDAEAIKEGAEKGAAGSRFDNGKTGARDGGDRTQEGYRDSTGRNKRSVWTVATAPYSGAHFATFPPKLIEPCILAGTSERGVCPECGKPWERVMERTPMEVKTSEKGAAKHDAGLRTSTSGTMTKPPTSKTTGWRPTCECVHNGGNRNTESALLTAPEPVPAVVLDPFVGSGTTVRVANEHGRKGVGLDISADYFKLSKQRTDMVQRRFA